MNFKDKYVKEMSAVKPNEDFYAETLRLISQTARRKENAIMKRKPVKILAVVMAIIAFLSVSAYAISTYLSAKDVAEKTGYEGVAPLFENSQFEPETITYGEYSVTLHGVVSAEEIQKIDGAEVEENRSYIVVSISRSDGTATTITNDMSLQFSPLVAGFEVWKVNLWSLEAGASGLEHEGVQYYLFDTKNIEIFADHTVYIAAYEGFVPSEEIFTMKEDGSIVYNENYQGFKAMFTLDLDESKSDPKAVEELLAPFNAE